MRCEQSRIDDNPIDRRIVRRTSTPVGVRLSAKATYLLHGDINKVLDHEAGDYEITA
jgi:hypothetical protein